MAKGTEHVWEVEAAALPAKELITLVWARTPGWAPLHVWAVGRLAHTRSCWKTLTHLARH